MRLVSQREGREVPFDARQQVLVLWQNQRSRTMMCCQQGRGVCISRCTPFSATLEKLNSRFGGNGAGDFNIQWSQASYASQKNVLSGGRLAGGDKTAAFDYSLLQSSAHTLPTIGRAGLSTRAVDKHGNLRPL